MKDIIIEYRYREDPPDFSEYYEKYERRIRAIEERMEEQELRGWITKNGRHILIGESSSSSRRLYHHDPETGGGGSGGSANKNNKKNSLTSFLNDDTITDKETEFKRRLKAGEFNTEVEPRKQQNHLYGKPWKNQVKQAIQSRKSTDPNKHQTPKSVLASSLDPQSLIEQYSGTGIIVFSGDKKTANEFIKLPFITGKTFDEKSGRYVSTHTIQIKYTNNGTHVLPTKDV